MLIHYNCMEKYGKYINQKYIFLCFTEESQSYRVESTEGWVNDKKLIFGELSI